MDARYLIGLSDDAVPALMDGFGSLDPGTKCLLAKNLLQREERLLARDWRSWNWSTSAALGALLGHEEDLKKAVVSQ